MNERHSIERPDGSRWDIEFENMFLGAEARIASLRVEVPHIHCAGMDEAERRLREATDILRGKERPEPTFMGLTFAQWKDKLQARSELCHRMAVAMRDMDNAMYNQTRHDIGIPAWVYERHQATIEEAIAMAHDRDMRRNPNQVPKRLRHEDEKTRRLAQMYSATPMDIDRILSRRREHDNITVHHISNPTGPNAWTEHRWMSHKAQGGSWDDLWPAKRMAFQWLEANGYDKMVVPPASHTLSFEERFPVAWEKITSWTWIGHNPQRGIVGKAYMAGGKGAPWYRRRLQEQGFKAYVKKTDGSGWERTRPELQYNTAEEAMAAATRAFQNQERDRWVMSNIVDKHMRADIEVRGVDYVRDDCVTEAGRAAGCWWTGDNKLMAPGREWIGGLEWSRNGFWHLRRWTLACGSKVSYTLPVTVAASRPALGVMQARRLLEEAVDFSCLPAGPGV